MTNKNDSKESKLSRYMKATIRLLSKARDLYIQGMTDCSGQLAYADATMGYPAGQPTTLPRSFSVSSTRSTASDDDFKELMRAASVRSYGNQVHEFDVPAKQSNTVPRSRSVGIGRIDEDKPCDFKDEVKVKPDIYPRSRSYAVSRRAEIF